MTLFPTSPDPRIKSQTLNLEPQENPHRTLPGPYGKPWWATQPGVTSKSGWITLQADPTAFARSEGQVVACSLGISIAAVDAVDVNEADDLL